MTGLTDKDLQLRSLRQAETHRVLGTEIGQELLRNAKWLADLAEQVLDDIDEGNCCLHRQDVEETLRSARVLLDEIARNRDTPAEQRARDVALQDFRYHQSKGE